LHFRISTLAPPGLGISTSSGQFGLVKPTKLIKSTGEKLTIDGIECEFIMAPGRYI
jgi:alkyl sulfatase BDS1-like metallo-beta-lactamase superfamily hydrolase